MRLLNYFKNQKEDKINFNLLPDGIFTLETDGRIIDIWTKQMYNYKKFEGDGIHEK